GYNYTYSLHEKCVNFARYVKVHSFSRNIFASVIKSRVSRRVISTKTLDTSTNSLERQRVSFLFFCLGNAPMERSKKFIALPIAGNMSNRRNLRLLAVARHYTE
ncbi:hypothetical protein K0M31_004335, partial [Melipona bicolor]